MQTSRKEIQEAEFNKYLTGDLERKEREWSKRNI